MFLLIAVLVVGVVVGLLLGGNLRALGELSFRWWPLALIGFALQLIPVPASSRALGVGLLIGSYAVLTAFVAANIRIPGMPLMAIGFVLNIVAVAVNGGMPVSQHAMRVAYGSQTALRSQLESLVKEGGAKHHLQRPDDVLIVLTDVIPAPTPVHLVLSVGDVLYLIGAGWVMAAATLGRANGRRPEGGRHRAGYVKRLREEPQDPAAGRDEDRPREVPRPRPSGSAP